MLPLVIQPRLPPLLALSSLYADATVLNDSPALSFSRASRHLDCFSHRMCLTFTAVPPLISFFPPPSPASAPPPFPPLPLPPPPPPLFFGILDKSCIFSKY